MADPLPIAPPTPPPPPRAASVRSLRLKHEGLDQKAFHAIKEMILRRELLPGKKVPQEHLATALGISRTPLINALKLLEKEGSIVRRPRRGYVVREFNREEMVALFEVREVLEGLAARKATENLTADQLAQLRGFFAAFDPQTPITAWEAYAREDQAFHSFIIAHGANRFLQDILEAHDVFHASYQTSAAGGLVRPPDQTLGEHRAIIDAICARDAAAAERQMCTHLANTIAALRAAPPPAPAP